jgi:hypothetical protein
MAYLKRLAPPALVSATQSPAYGTDEFKGTCYIAGPMTGYPAFNYKKFDWARDELLGEGWNVVNPADLDRINIGIDFSAMTGKEDLSKHIHAFARQDITALLCVDAVFCLGGWEKSTGATNEARIATMLGVPVWSFNDRVLIDIDARFSNSGQEVTP